MNSKKPFDQNIHQISSTYTNMLYQQTNKDRSDSKSKNNEYITISRIHLNVKNSKMIRN